MDKIKVLIALNQISKNLLIELNEHEKEELFLKIKSLEYDFEKLAQINTDGYEPMNCITRKVNNQLRDDSIVEEFDNKVLFDNSSNTHSESNFVIEGDDNFE
jgi:aspartyl/glutamyl-tRNA(Asn/Gln) amidotransferase C subunit